MISRSSQQSRSTFAGAGKKQRLFSGITDMIPAEKPLFIIQNKKLSALVPIVDDLESDKRQIRIDFINH